MTKLIVKVNLSFKIKVEPNTDGHNTNELRLVVKINDIQPDNRTSIQNNTARLLDFTDFLFAIQSSQNEPYSFENKIYGAGKKMCALL